jgi:predicted ArsR family transcriptional regulator
VWAPGPLTGAGSPGAVDDDAEQGDDHAHEDREVRAELRRSEPVRVVGGGQAGEVGADVTRAASGQQDQPEARPRWKCPEGSYHAFYREHALVIHAHCFRCQDLALACVFFRMTAMPVDPADLEAIALLDEPVRRALYEWVVRSGRAVNRDEAATAVKASRALTAFHLDRLVRGGLLETEYRRLSGRTGPGAGRPAKLYRRADREIVVALPARQYQLPAELFAATIEQMADVIPPGPLVAAAGKIGRDVGTEARRRAGPRPGRRRLRSALVETLEQRGYEPSLSDSGEIRLGNCPFDALVADHRDLVCGMNLALAEGMLDGLRDRQDRARLDPQPGRCCVAIAPPPAVSG